MRRVNLLVLLSLIASSLYGVSASQAAEETIDLSKRNRYALGICQSAKQLDCLEPTVTVTHKDGSTSIAQHVSSQFTGPFLDMEGVNSPRVHKFKVNFGTRNGPIREFDIQINFASPSWQPFGGVTLFVKGIEALPSNSECEEPFKKLCTQFNLDPDDNYTLQVRTQHLPVLDLTSGSRNSDITREEYLIGERWTLSGSQSVWGRGAMMGWGIGTYGPNGEAAFKDSVQCAQFGPIFRSSNAYSQGQPYWDAAKESLNFNVSGIHLDRFGELTKGFFKARLPKKWINCRYPGNSLANASQVKVNITYVDGSVQAATAITTVTDEIILVDVPLLHYSSPIIRISNASSVIKATPKPKYCTKAKEKKKMTGNKCPSGWKLVV